MAKLSRESLGYEDCLHRLDAFGYDFRWAAVRGLRATLHCWTRQENAKGERISHVLVRSKLTPEKVSVRAHSSRAVLLISRDHGFT